MQIKMQAFVVQASRYSMDDGTRGGHINYLSDPSEPNPNRTGKDIIKLAASYETKEKLCDQLPANCDLVVEVVQGGQNKGSLKLVSVELSKPAKPAQ